MCQGSRIAKNLERGKALGSKDYLISKFIKLYQDSGDTGIEVDKWNGLVD
jgi:hypothetical protein